MLLYAITGRGLLPASEAEQQARLVAMAREWTRGGVDYIQVREKDLPREQLLLLARQIVGAVHAEGGSTRVLVNGPAEVALEAAADGVHLPGAAIPGAGDEARQLYRRA